MTEKEVNEALLTDIFEAIPHPNFIDGYSTEYDRSVTEVEKDLLGKHAMMFGKAWQVAMDNGLQNFKFTQLKTVLMKVAAKKKSEWQLTHEVKDWAARVAKMLRAAFRHISRFAAHRSQAPWLTDILKQTKDGCITNDSQERNPMEEEKQGAKDEPKEEANEEPKINSHIYGYTK